MKETNQQIAELTDNKNFTKENAEKLHRIAKELRELGLSGVFGSFAIAETPEEEELFLLFERYFTNLEQKKVIERPFVR